MPNGAIIEESLNREAAYQSVGLCKRGKDAERSAAMLTKETAHFDGYDLPCPW
jgi:hypothetical protein